MIEKLLAASSTKIGSKADNLRMLTTFSTAEYANGCRRRVKAFTICQSARLSTGRNEDTYMQVNKQSFPSNVEGLLGVDYLFDPNGV